MDQRFAKQVSTVDRLRAIIPEPDEGVQRTQIFALDEHCRDFVARSPFVFVSTSNAAGECDVSPKGDAPGFALVLDEHTIAIPDRKGSRRADSLRNIIENPHAGLLFLIPGADWTLRVNGRASIVEDDELRARLAVKGNLPDVAIVIDVEEAFMHCPRCVLRAGLWDTASWMPADEHPNWAVIVRDHTRYHDVPLKLVEEALDEHNRDLY